MKTYRLAIIYKDSVKDCKNFSTKSFIKAHTQARQHMRQNTDVVSMLIYSDQNTSIVLQRKWA